MILPPIEGRRHDVDWLRVGALFLLIIYHMVAAFQSWGIWIGFVQNVDPMPQLWPAMEMINIWRIPILFVISGMGVRFAMERRNGKELALERVKRLLVPLAVGFILICPLTVVAAQLYYWRPLSYVPNVGHLWFLVNVLVYAIGFAPVLFWLKNRPENLWFRFSRALAKFPPLLILFALPFMAEGHWVDPQIYPLFAMSLHGWVIGAISFFLGFTFVSIGETFWRAAQSMRFPFLLIAVGLYLNRVVFVETNFGFPTPTGNHWIALESFCWILACLGFASRHLRFNSRALAYLNQAVFPIYILHLPVQNAICNFIFPTIFPPFVKLALTTFFTLAICFMIYEIVLRRVGWLQPLFGMKRHANKNLPA